MTKKVIHVCHRHLILRNTLSDRFFVLQAIIEQQHLSRRRLYLVYC